MSNPYLSLLEEAQDISAAKDWVYRDRRSEWVNELKRDAQAADKLMDARLKTSPDYKPRKARVSAS